MGLVDSLALGCNVAFSVTNLIYCFTGVFIGTLIGVLPGIGPPERLRFFFLYLLD